jgi:hypothetical protein
MEEGQWNCFTTLFSPGPLHFANGLPLDSLERHLRVVDVTSLRIEIERDGRAGSAEVYAQGLKTIPDGLAFDATGNLT